MSSAQGKRKRRRFRRLMKRGRLEPAIATALSKRTRSEWPRTKAQTRQHRYKYMKKPMKKWAEFEKESA